ncbi:MAG: FAD-dependent oxidoreductase, partial [Actinomycetes bacterium]
MTTGAALRAAEAEVVVVGGGHNGLVAAAYLAGAGRSVLVLERLDAVGGAAVSRQVFDGVDVRLSAYAYLVSLLPDRIVQDLSLDLALADRSVASFTPVHR